jgi:predicted branched-subunit amino acid permease
MKTETKRWLLRGLRDGVPIGLGYFAVAVALGINASGAGISALEAALMSALNMTSAGEAAAITMLGLGTTYVELAFTQLVINLRYLLMSCSLSQKIAPETSVLHRLLVGYAVTDEIFGAEMAVQGRLAPAYTYGIYAMAVPGWTLGTLLGVLLGNVLPARAISALGVALYAMLLAAILPAARKSRVIAGVVIVSMLASATLSFLVDHFLLSWLTEGFRIILLTVVISLIAALLFPVKEEREEVACDGT